MTSDSDLPVQPAGEQDGDERDDGEHGQKNVTRQAVRRPRGRTSACSGNSPAARISSAANIHITRFRRGRAQVSSGL